MIRDLYSRACNVGRASRTCRTRGGSAGLASFQAPPKCETPSSAGAHRPSAREARRQDRKFAWRPAAKSPMSGVIGREKKSSGGGEARPNRSVYPPRRLKWRGRGAKAVVISARGGVGAVCSWAPSAARIRACENSACFHLNFNARRTVPTSRAGSVSRRPRLSAWDGRNIVKSWEIRKILPPGRLIKMYMPLGSALAARRQLTCLVQRSYPVLGWVPSFRLGGSAGGDLAGTSLA